MQNLELSLCEQLRQYVATYVMAISLGLIVCFFAVLFLAKTVGLGSHLVCESYAQLSAIEARAKSDMRNARLRNSLSRIILSVLGLEDYL